MRIRNYRDSEFGISYNRTCCYRYTILTTAITAYLKNPLLCTAMDPSSSVGLPELGAAARAALDVWKVYEGAPPNHSVLSGDIASLHIVLKELQWQAERNSLGPNLQQELASLVRQSQLVLKDLEALVEENTTSYNAAQSDQEGWSEEDILEVKARLVSLTNLMIGFNSNITRYVRFHSTYLEDSLYKGRDSSPNPGNRN